jgi:hypothetical protein
LVFRLPAGEGVQRDVKGAEVVCGEREELAGIDRPW